jgi:LEA14-like dessication related protein
MKKLAVRAVLATMVAMAACSYLGRQAFKQPVVQLRDVRVRGIGITGGSLDVLLAVYNPNHYRLDATHLSYQVLLNSDSVTLADGNVDQHFTVPGDSMTVVTIPVNYKYAGIGAAERELVRSGAVNYHVRGDVTVGSTIGHYTVPYSSTGRFTTTGLGR